MAGNVGSELAPATTRVLRAIKMLKPDDIRRLPPSLLEWLTEISRLGTVFYILPSAEHSVFVLQKALEISRQQAPSKSVSEEANITGRPLLESAFRTVTHGLKGMQEQVCEPPLMNRDADDRGLVGGLKVIGLRCLGWTSSGERLDNLISSISRSLVDLITLLLAEISQLHENALQIPKEEWNTKVTDWRLVKKDLQSGFTLLELRLQPVIKDGSSHVSRSPRIVAECDTEIHIGSELFDPMDTPSMTSSTHSASSGSGTFLPGPLEFEHDDALGPYSAEVSPINSPSYRSHRIATTK